MRRAPKGFFPLLKGQEAVRWLCGRGFQAFKWRGGPGARSSDMLRRLADDCTHAVL
jgi:hypothetical protein